MDRDELKGIIRDILSANLGEGARAPEPGGPRAEVLDLVTEKHVMAARTDSKVVYVTPDALVTPLARETADRYGVPIETVSSVPVAPPAAGAPHAAPATARDTGPIAR